MDGMYEDDLSKECENCNYPCINCSSASECLTCVDYINRNESTCQCNNGIKIINLLFSILREKHIIK